MLKMQLLLLYVTLATLLSTTHSKKLHLNTTGLSTLLENEKEKVAQIQVYTQLQTLCMAFHVALENCTCDLFNEPTKNGKTFCQIEEELKKTKRRLIYSPELSIPIATAGLSMSVIGIVGNSVIVVVAHRKKDATKFQQLIKMLAISDFLFSFLQLLLSIPLFWTNQWQYGTFFCKTLMSGKMFGDLLYIGFLVLMSVERYFMVVRSSKEITNKKLYIGVLLNLIIAAGTILPLPIIYRVDDMGICGEGWKNVNQSSIVYQCFLLVFYLFIPGVIVATLCFNIYKKLTLQSKLRKIDVTASHMTSGKKLIVNQLAVKMIVCMLAAFVVCTLPNRIAWLYLRSNNEIKSSAYVVLSLTALLTYPVLVCINPIIYSIVDKTWRDSIVDVLFCCRASSPYLTNQDGLTTTNKNFSTTTIPRINAVKTDKGRNLSIDQGTHLLSYNPSYFTMPTTNVDVDTKKVET